VAGDFDEGRLELTGAGQFAIRLDEPGIGLLELGDQPATLGQEVVLFDPLMTAWMSA
jgi:hypothetical protein